ncbi:MAG TPA: 2-amino-4-hydroxy-6-hydroxymethyldihydropteridine diphosphokinase [Candidatus Dormibacteraeota bacterium]|nr:2-amino-4-hydroxy-6-hydroxymethyldihydropteridine diphosphokinase [Candidatus Dormibacteraeota bacterium]
MNPQAPGDYNRISFVALGANLGDARKTVLQAIDRLQELSASKLLRSSLWATTPVDCPPGSPDFFNAVVGFQPLPGETPETLLSKLQKLEKAFGRKPKRVMNEPRSLDLDLIAFGPEMRNSSVLILPHPRAAQRRFVLEPLSEIAPVFILPGQIKTIAELLENLPPDCQMRRLSARPWPM